MLEVLFPHVYLFFSFLLSPQTRDANHMGNGVKAQQNSRMARNLAHSALGVGVVLIIVYIVLIVVVSRWVHMQNIRLSLYKVFITNIVNILKEILLLFWASTDAKWRDCGIHNNVWCDQLYVGISGRSVKTRIFEHMSSMRNKVLGALLMSCLVDCNHSPEDLKVFLCDI